MPLICLPGLMCTPEVWDDTLAAAGFSAHVPALEAFDRIERIAEEVLRTSPDRFVLAGHSMGGYVALEMLRLAPERIAGLFLSSTSARADTEEQKAVRAQAVGKAQAVGMAKFSTSIAPFLLHPQSMEKPGIRDRLIGMAETVGADTFALHQQAIATRRDQRALLASIRCPTMVVVGEVDRLIPPALSEEIASLVPGAELRIITTAGHMTLLEDPAGTAAALGGLLRKLPAEAAHA